MADPAGIPALIDAIRHQHGVEARYLETVAVEEQAPDGETAWRGDVEVFELIGHPKATRVYAWSEATKAPKRRFFAALHRGPIDSAVAAVKASLLKQAQKATVRTRT